MGRARLNRGRPRLAWNNKVALRSGLSNVFAQIPAELAEEHFQCLLSAPGLRIERIVSQGHSSPEGFWYDQDTDEWVMLLAGAARLTLEGSEPFNLWPGGFVNIPAHQRH